MPRPPRTAVLHPFHGRVPGLPRAARPSFHALERRGPGRSVPLRGLVGTVDLHAVAERRVRRHEGVIEDQVDVQERRMRRMGGIDEPILLLARDLSPVGGHLERVTGGPADSVLGLAGGGVQGLWGCGDDSPRIAGWLADADPELLVADGHHRLEAALRIHRAHGGGPGPWSRLLAVVVDASRHPLALSAIHRTVRGLDIGRAVRAVSRLARVRPATGALPGPPEPGTFLLCGQGQTWQVRDLAPPVVERWQRGVPPLWRGLDVALADHLLIPALCADQDVPRPVTYSDRLPDPHAAGQVAVVLAAPSPAQVWAHAAAGVAMPRKSSSFGPKPAPGQICCLARDQHDEHGQHGGRGGRGPAAAGARADASPGLELAAPGTGPGPR